MTTSVGVITDQQTLERCINVTYQFSGTLYQNICDGSQHFVASGFLDYASFFFLLGIPVAVFAAIVGMFRDSS